MMGCKVFHFFLKYFSLLSCYQGIVSFSLLMSRKSFSAECFVAIVMEEGLRKKTVSVANFSGCAFSLVDGLVVLNPLTNIPF